MSAFWTFMQFIYGLQHSGPCVAYHANIIDGGEGGGVVPVVNVPVYLGSCVQSFWLVMQHYATYFSFGS